MERLEREAALVQARVRDGQPRLVDRLFAVEQQVEVDRARAPPLAALAPEFARALQDDPLAPRFLGFSALGLAEILRPRVHPPLHELLSGPHAAGLRALRRIAAEAAARPAAGFALRAAPDVVAALQADAEALADLARRTGRPLMLRSDPALPPGSCAPEETHRA